MTDTSIDILHEIKYMRYLAHSAKSAYTKIIDDNNQNGGRNYKADKVEQFKQQVFVFEGAMFGIDLIIEVFSLNNTIGCTTEYLADLTSKLVAMYHQKMNDGELLDRDAIKIELRTQFELSELNAEHTDNKSGVFEND